MRSAVHNLRLLLLGAWIGAAIFFSAVVAPSAFHVSRAYGLSNAVEIAGGIVSRTLYVINVSGFVISLALLISAIALKRTYKARVFVVQLMFLAILALTTGVGEFIIARKLRALRAAASIPINQLAETDPVRVVFDALHGYSVAALSIAIIAALISFFVMTRRAD